MDESNAKSIHKKKKAMQKGERETEWGVPILVPPVESSIYCYAILDLITLLTQLAAYDETVHVLGIKISDILGVSLSAARRPLFPIQVYI